MSDKPYWHEVMTEAAFDKMVAERPEMTWGDVALEYEQPDWCDYPHALLGQMGCWSLVLQPFRICGIDDCENCECVEEKPMQKGFEFRQFVFCVDGEDMTMEQADELLDVMIESCVERDLCMGGTVVRCDEDGDSASEVRVNRLVAACQEAMREIEYQHSDMLTQDERNHPRGSGWARVYDRLKEVSE